MSSTMKPESLLARRSHDVIIVNFAKTRFRFVTSFGIETGLFSIEQRFYAEK